MKRREFLHNALATAGMAAAGFLEVETGEAAERRTEGNKTAARKIVRIGHKPDRPPGTHLYLKECELLAKCLRQTAGVAAVVSDGWPREADVWDGVKGKDEVVACVYDRKDSAGGRSYGNTLGHFHENFGLEPFRRAIVNGILWTVHREIPEEGAPCMITADDMKL